MTQKNTFTFLHSSDKVASLAKQKKPESRDALTVFWPSGGHLACVLKYCFPKSCFSNLLCYPHYLCCHLTFLAWSCSYADLSHLTFEASDFCCHAELARIPHLRTSYVRFYSLKWLFLFIQILIPNQKNMCKKKPTPKYKAKQWHTVHIHHQCYQIA